MDALRACKQGHVFLSVTKQGLTAIVETEGNEATHIILRGSNKGPNYSKEHVSAISEKARNAGLQWRLMVDCSHGNSQKKHENQKIVAEDIVCYVFFSLLPFFILIVFSYLDTPTR